ncbi:MAG: sigma 54-interacting transcriptional regulator [Planctomycetes bacterium]|nr:sigma 54-interacting transcriptional regulator [Planctomycetota bacterium]
MQIKIVKGNDSGKTFEVGGLYTIGRVRENDIHIRDDTASRKHTEIRAAGGALVVRDLGSRNGTLVGGARIEGEVLVGPGERFLVGDTLFEVINDQREEDKDTVAKAGREEDDKLLVKSTISAKSADILQTSGAQDSELVSRIRKVFEMDENVSGVLDFEAIAERSLPILRDLIGCDRVYLDLSGCATQGRANEDLVFRHVSGKSDHGFRPPRSVVRRLGASSEAILVEDVEEDMRSRDAKSFLAKGIQSAMAVSLSYDGIPLGFIYADIREQDRPGREVRFTRSDLEVFAHVAGKIATYARGALILARTQTEADSLRTMVEEKYRIVGSSKKIAIALDLVRKAAPADVAVLITGETGVGKELVARMLHSLSPRRNARFEAINCAAISETLIESELFGHEKGAFTGADKRKAGRFELASGGTLFLDEISELPLDLQPKLLRVLQEREFYRVGGTETIRTNARIACASNRDLAEEVRGGRFRDDLLFRLRVIQIDVPPLRERREDIRILAEHFLTVLGAKMNRRDLRLSPESVKLLESHSWPGNVRELHNAIERALIITNSRTILPEHFPSEITDKSTVRGMGEIGNRVMSIADAERIAIVAALRHTNGRKGEAAELLGISHPTLNKKIQDYKIGGEL